MGAGPAEFVARPTVTWMPRLAARWSGRSAGCDGLNGREVFVLKGYDEVAVFLGLDVGKEGHHSVAQERQPNPYWISSARVCWLPDLSTRRRESGVRPLHA